MVQRGINAVKHGRELNLRLLSGMKRGVAVLGDVHHYQLFY